MLMWLLDDQEATEEDKMWNQKPPCDTVRVRPWEAAGGFSQEGILPPVLKSWQQILHLCDNTCLVRGATHLRCLKTLLIPEKKNGLMKTQVSKQTKTTKLRKNRRCTVNHHGKNWSGRHSFPTWNQTMLSSNLHMLEWRSTMKEVTGFWLSEKREKEKPRKKENLWDQGLKNKWW